MTNSELQQSLMKVLTAADRVEKARLCGLPYRALAWERKLDQYAADLADAVAERELEKQAEGVEA